MPLLEGAFDMDTAWHDNQGTAEIAPVASHGHTAEGDTNRPSISEVWQLPYFIQRFQ